MSDPIVPAGPIGPIGPIGSIDPARCPLCGRPNACAIASGRGVCWCFAIKVPEEVLDRIPPEARDRACVCERCATAGR